MPGRAMNLGAPCALRLTPYVLGKLDPANPKNQIAKATSAIDTEMIIVISSTVSRRAVVRSPRMLLSQGGRNCTSDSCPVTRAYT